MCGQGVRDLDRDAIARPRVVIAAGIDDGDIEIIEAFDRAGDRFARRQSDGGLDLVTGGAAGIGAAKALVTMRPWWATGLEMTMVGILEAAVTYGLGRAFARG